MKRYGYLSVFSFLVLSFTAVFLGGLNQDEGWYLYAASSIASGLKPYRDFAFTQGPVMPTVYSWFSFVWDAWGMVGARIFTLAVGATGIGLLMKIAADNVGQEDKKTAAVMVGLLLGSNLYHLYYLVIPKTYALAALFLATGFLVLNKALLFHENSRSVLSALTVGLSAFLFSLSAGTRISLCMVLVAVGVTLIIKFREFKWAFLYFGIGGALGLSLIFFPYLADESARAGLLASFSYHSARDGFDAVFTVGSLSRLARYYSPVFIIGGLAVAAGALRRIREKCAASSTMFLAMILSFFAVFISQLLAPYPYEDYQVPIMGIASVVVTVAIVSAKTKFSVLLLTLGLVWITAFGSPLLEEWTINGYDRFWAEKKESTEIEQLRAMAKLIEDIDPGGDTLLTQDLYLAVETGRRVPRGLEMGPFSILTDAQWEELLKSAPCKVAALSGYSFAINPPKCDEVPIERQMKYWYLLKENYSLVHSEKMFGQNHTTLLILKRNDDDAEAK